MKTLIGRSAGLLGGVALWAIGSAASAQVAPTSESAAGPAAATSEQSEFGEIIVTAQRRAQNIQDVPASITAVSGAQLADLNIFKLEDVSQLAPGLVLESNGAFGSVAQLRGVGFNSNASAAPAVDIYFNNTPVDANYAFQAIYDIGQIEVLRGPQGTLRGRPAPGGAVTITTRRPDLSGFGAYASISFSEQNATNLEAAVNVPLINDVLALRVSGLYDENDVNGVRNFNGLKENRETKSWRASLRLAPTDAIDVTLMHQSLTADRLTLNWVEGPGSVYNGPAISGPQRRAVQEGPSGGKQESEITTVQVTWNLAGHRLSYSGAIQDNSFSNFGDNDSFNGVVGFAPDQDVHSSYKVDSHELILASTGEDQFIDYQFGAWYQKTKTFTSVDVGSPLPGAFGSPLAPSGTGPVNPAFVLPVHIELPSLAKNYAVFGDLTFHLTRATQLEVGVRYLEDKSTRSSTSILGLAVVAVPLPFPCAFVPGSVGSTYASTCNFPVGPKVTTVPSSRNSSAFVYNASLKHNFSDDFMGYVRYGHSFRPAGVSTVTGVTADLVQGDNETSDSYEAGFKSKWLDGRLRFNAAVYHQDFKNFIGRFEEVPYIDVSNQVSSGGFTYPGDAKIDGGEIELAYDFTHRWNAALNASVSSGKYDNARVPCRDTNNDGVPDGGNNPPAASFPAGQSVFYCAVNDSISTVAPWSLTLQSEYNFPVGGAEGYVRGLFTYFGKNDNLGPTYVAEGYGLLNLYVGARAEAGWDVSIWAKNLLDEQNILTRGNTNQIYQGAFQTGYHGISYTKPREIGVTLRYAFGAR